MQLISKFNKITCFLLCFIDIYSKYAWVVPLKYKKGIYESKRKPKKVLVDEGSGFYNRSMKSWLQGKLKRWHRSVFNT